MSSREIAPRTPTGQFQKGHSGNPTGRAPRGQTFAEALRAQLEQVRNGTSTRDRLAAAVVEMAFKGNLDAVKWLVERVDGKVPDRLEADTTTTHRLDETTLDAVAARWIRLRALRDGDA